MLSWNTVYAKLVVHSIQQFSARPLLFHGSEFMVKMTFWGSKGVGLRSREHLQMPDIVSSADLFFAVLWLHASPPIFYEFHERSETVLARGHWPVFGLMAVNCSEKPVATDYTEKSTPATEVTSSRHWPYPCKSISEFETDVKFLSLSRHNSHLYLTR